MNIAELKEIIADLPDDMPVYLLDVTVDDQNGSYDIEEDEIGVGEGTAEDDDDEIIGKALWINFDNRLNENPINVSDEEE